MLGKLRELLRGETGPPGPQGDKGDPGHLKITGENIGGEGHMLKLYDGAGHLVWAVSTRIS